ncbi:Crp/Fnr family transcriptional regulator [Campylobacter sp. MIT 99-7217]|uniref:Crp/Fnr family transcriptional regulator n=1 Tax=Campylobacter sp. MIT 99-7217 TaxID=535091 RepID=UPI0011583427|nr:Crp/Fnr family transcriptional regulator [Campylobacter sp. MIT 99-7217]TQR34737.1 Crp/Fnr family transcriptional regulator [Campylobacter sp. MIT 99-7217]
MQNLDFLQEIALKKHYKKGNILFYQGEKAQKFFLLLEGKVRVYKNIGEKELNLHHFRSGSFIAEMPAFKEINYPASAEFESDSCVLEIDFEAFKNLCLKDSKYSFLMILSLFEKIKILENKLTQSSQSLKQRLSSYLLKHKESLSKLTQRKIAQDLNTKAESISRIIKELRALKYITTTKGKIEILNFKALEQSLED